MKDQKQYRNLRIMTAEKRVPEAELQTLVAENQDPPEFLSDDARAIFVARAAEMVRAGYWLPRYSDALALYSELTAEYRQGPADCSAAKITQLRLLMSELGLTPQSSRGVTK